MEEHRQEGEQAEREPLEEAEETEAETRNIELRSRRATDSARKGGQGEGELSGPNLGGLLILAKVSASAARRLRAAD